MSEQEPFSQINHLLLCGQLDQAEQALLKAQALSPTEQRMKLHFEGLVFFQKGQISKAKQVFERAIHECGENINLLRDLIVCQFHLQDLTGFRQNLSLFEHRLKELDAKLSVRTRLEGHLILGKLLEEEGRLAPAWNAFKIALTLAQKPTQTLRVQIQMARWMALYDARPELSYFYRDLISVKLDELTLDLRIELQHTLTLIEMELIGFSHAWQRYLNLAVEIGDVDRRLIFFDILEGLLYRDKDIPADLQAHISEFQDLDPFERFLTQLVKGSVTLVDLTTLASQTSWSNYVRALCLAANATESEESRMEFNRKIQLIANSLDPHSQTLWRSRLKKAFNPREVHLEFSLPQRRLSVNGRSSGRSPSDKEVDLSKKKLALQLFEALSHKREMSVDEAIGLLWQSPFSPEHYHRLRMGVHRLNVLIHRVTGVGKVVEVDSQSVRLRPEIQLSQKVDQWSAVSSMELN